MDRRGDACVRIVSVLALSAGMLGCLHEGGRSRGSRTDASMAADAADRAQDGGVVDARVARDARVIADAGPPPVCRPHPENCNCVDDDCDGLVDEDGVCGGCRVFVDHDAAGAGTGLSWRDAFDTVQAGLDSMCEVWIAEGVYLPTERFDPSSPRTASFIVKSSTRVLGGFEGTEGCAEERDVEAHPTILSGDLEGDDAAGSLDDNVYTVVSGLWSVDPRVSALTLDGLTVQGGRAEQHPGAPDRIAAAIDWGRGELTLDHVSIRGNTGQLAPVDTDASIVAVSASAGARLSFVRLEDNAFEVVGGAFIQLAPGALHVSGTARIEDSVFVRNRALGCGAVRLSAADAVVLRTLFADNEGVMGGALAATEGVLSVEGSRFERNRSTFGGAGVQADGLAVRILDSSFEANAGTSVRVVGDPAADHSLNLRRVHIAGSTNTAISAMNARVVIDHSVFTGNRRERAGSVVSLYDPPQEPTTALTITSSTLAFNHSADGSTIWIAATSVDTLRVRVVLWNDIVAENTWEPGGSGRPISVRARVTVVASQGHSILQEWTDLMPGTHISAATPSFVDAVGADGRIGTLDDDVRLAEGSAGIDAGDAAALTPDRDDLDGDGDLEEPVPFDLRGRARRTDMASVADTGSGDAPMLDLGALERQAGD